MREEEITEIEGRYLGATPGPWKSWIEGRDHTSGDSVITTAGDDIYLVGASDADQDFVASARQDIPKLVAEVRRLRGLLGN